MTAQAEAFACFRATGYRATPSGGEVEPGR
jgi:hypothetical protein